MNNDDKDGVLIRALEALEEAQHALFNAGGQTKSCINKKLYDSAWHKSTQSHAELSAFIDGVPNHRDIVYCDARNYNADMSKHLATGVKKHDR